MQTYSFLISSWLPEVQPSGSQTLFKGRKQGGRSVWREFPHQPFLFYEKGKFLPRRSSAGHLHVLWKPSLQGRLGESVLTFSCSRVGVRQGRKELRAVANLFSLSDFLTRILVDFTTAFSRFLIQFLFTSTLRGSPPTGLLLTATSDFQQLPRVLHYFPTAAWVGSEESGEL